MTRPLLGVVALALAAGLQGALSVYVPGVAAFFDFFLIVATYYALTTNQVSGMLVGTVCGLVQDVLGAYPIGQNAFAKTLICYLVAGLGKRLEFSQPATHFLVLAGATLLNAVTISVLHLVLGLPADLPSATMLVIRMVANGLSGMVLYSVVSRRTERQT